jgi:Arc/MetJ-type ribon-helix-helix transcriptional regulator
MKRKNRFKKLLSVRLSDREVRQLEELVRKLSVDGLDHTDSEVVRKLINKAWEDLCARST